MANKDEIATTRSIRILDAAKKQPPVDTRRYIRLAGQAYFEAGMKHPHSRPGRVLAAMAKAANKEKKP